MGGGGGEGRGPEFGKRGVGRRKVEGKGGFKVRMLVEFKHVSVASQRQGFRTFFVLSVRIDQD